MRLRSWRVLGSYPSPSRSFISWMRDRKLGLYELLRVTHLDVACLGAKALWSFWSTMRLSFTNVHLTCYSIKWTAHDVIQKSWNKFSSFLLSLHFITIELLIYILKALGGKKNNSAFFPFLDFWTWTDIIYINGSMWASEALATLGQPFCCWPHFTIQVQYMAVPSGVVRGLLFHIKSFLTCEKQCQY